MRPLLIVGTLFIAACSSDGILTPDQSGLTRQANISDNPQQPTCVLKSTLTFYVAAGRTKGNGSFSAPFGYRVARRPLSGCQPSRDQSG